ncbi:alpha/beta hydrolase-fold protein [Longispora albida]|uniref:alpha/beta hydrolase-fold protein n=1 Tax=Longispora albida TaxID=203523 RepID=UPI000372D684|nr:alpha/beta hydrolase-fold protein [Longispora albida]
MNADELIRGATGKGFRLENPIVEPSGTPGMSTVTFTWQGEAEQVVLLGQLGDFSDLSKTAFTRHEGDEWSLTLDLPDNLRATYRILVDPPANELLPEHWPSLQVHHDPRNPREFVFPGGTKLSVVELPDAPAQPWVNAGDSVPAGKVTAHDSGYDDRETWVYTPHGYSTDGAPYPLLVVFDGDGYVTDTVPAPTILDNLIAAGRIPPVVALFVHSGHENARRSEELSCNPGYFEEQLVGGLLPWVRSGWHVSEAPATVTGSSLGGTFAAYAALSRPDLFGAVLSQSGSFGWKNERMTGFELAADVADGPARPIRWYLEAGSLETTKSVLAESILDANRRMRDALLARGYELHYSEYSGGHDYVSWRGSLADGLIALYGADVPDEVS